MNKKISYTFVIADLFHYGHLRVLEQAKKFGNYHICAILSDDICAQWHGQNLCSLNERSKVIEACSFVDEVMVQNSIDPTENLRKILKKYNDCEITVFHGDDWNVLPGKLFMENNNIGTKLIKYYKRLSRTSIYHHFSKKSNSSNSNISDYKLNNIVNLFETKAQTLETLNKLLNKSLIEPLYTFKVKDFFKSKSKIIKQIQTKFSKKIIVRSSTSKEDGLNRSCAGEFLTVQNIDAFSEKSISNAINKVIAAYKERMDSHSDEEILIQEQSEGIILSGVVFTKGLQTNSPYYVITYDDQSGKTDTVTSGQSSSTIWLHRDTKKYKCPTKWKNLIESINEIENIFKSMVLDIEFAIRKNGKVIIYQVRPLAANIKYIDLNEDYIDDSTEKIVSDYQIYSQSGSNLLSDMAFWNPSELIGENPKPMSYSIFEDILMKKHWNIGLTEIGYSEVNKNLIYKIGNKPYINVDYSIKALLPSSLPENIRKKLEKYYKNKFVKNLHNHDKFEFEVIHSSHLFESELADLMPKILKKKEYTIYKQLLKRMTIKIIKNYPKKENQFINDVKKCLKKSVNENTNNHLSIINNIFHNINLLKQYATSQFSTAARMAFISKSILNSLLKENYLKEEEISLFYQSLNTVAAQYKNDFKRLSLDKFKNKFGHLRSGTYSLTSTKLEDRELKKTSINVNKKDKFNKNKFINILDEVLKKNKLEVSKDNLYNFLSKSFQLREYLKFEYTKVISSILDMMSNLSNILNIPIYEFEYLTLDVLKSGLNFETKTECSDFYNTFINKSRNEFIGYKKLIQNQVICDKNDFYIIEHKIAKPNYITSKSIEGNVLLLDNSKFKASTLNNKIIMIESADPGYDWIFTHNIKGLITKFGGVGSHMAIRCAEFNLPAAIGCGNAIFNNLLNSKRIKLDCNNNQIINLTSNEVFN